MVADDVDALGTSKRTDDFSDLQNQLTFQTFGLLDRGLERNKGMDALASQVIVPANNSGFGNSFVKDEGGLNLRGGQTMAGDIDYIWMKKSVKGIRVYGLSNLPSTRPRTQI